MQISQRHDFFSFEIVIVATLIGIALFHMNLVVVRITRAHVCQSPISDIYIYAFANAFICIHIDVGLFFLYFFTISSFVMFSFAPSILCSQMVGFLLLHLIIIFVFIIYLIYSLMVNYTVMIWLIIISKR